MRRTARREVMVVMSRWRGFRNSSMAEPVSAILSIAMSSRKING